MARQAGPHYFIGRIGDLIYYKSNGVYLVKRANKDIQKESKKEMEERKRREGKIEFGGGAVLSKLLKDTFDAVVAPYNDSALGGRLTGVFRKIIKKGSGKEGMRRAEIGKHGALLRGFQFHHYNVFDRVFKPKLIWEVKKRRREIVMSVPAFSIRGNVSKPAGASHYRISMVTGILSDHTYSRSKMKYIPCEVSLNGKSVTVYSDYLDLDNSSHELRLSARFRSAVPEGCAVVVLTGIKFYKKEAGAFYDLATKRALYVAEVFHG